MAKTAVIKVKNDKFKPFVVQGEGKRSNIFRVVELHEKVTRKQIETLLTKLPITFCLKAENAECFEHINEPLEVRVYGGIINIHPPKHRIIAYTSFDSWGSGSVISKMKVDNVMDTVDPGNGQIRTCIYFYPKILGIRHWPQVGINNELELDIHVYPKGKEQEHQLEPPGFSKVDVGSLLELIAGGEKPLSEERFEQWQDLILYAVKSMRNSYENPDVAEDYPIRFYYKKDWKMIDEAGDDSKKLIDALENLRISIGWE